MIILLAIFVVWGYNYCVLLFPKDLEEKREDIMGFEGLLGNQRLKDNLTAGASRGKLAHFYLISGPEGSGKKTLARLLGAAAICQDEGQRPCLRCNACRKVMADTHPDFITVADPEHKTVPVKLVRDYREDIFIRPNEAE